MVNWNRFSPKDFEYDFNNDKLWAHRITFEEAVECFFSDFEVHRNKKFKDRFQLFGQTIGGRKLKIIFQLKPGNIVRIISRMGNMKTKRKVLTEEEIDDLVISQTEDKTAWEKPAIVRRSKSTSILLRADLAAKAAFFARLHKESSLENWLNRIIQERLDIEDAAFSGLKRDLRTKSNQ